MIPKWMIKSAIQRGISWLPASDYWYELIQTHITRSADLSEQAFEGRVKEAARFLDCFRQHQPHTPDGFKVLEVGTGWYPTYPLALYLCGASEIWSFDIAGFVRRERMVLLLDYFCGAYERGTLKQLLPSLREERVARLRELRAHAQTESPTECLARINIHLVVRDACQTGLPAKSVDFIFTQGVLHHLPRPILPKLLSEFRRVATDRAVMVHGLFLADQFSRFDATISEFNFLQFSEAQWRWRNSPLVPNTRFRITDYRRLFGAAGFAIATEENRLGSLDELKRIRLAPEFQHYPTADLQVLFSLVTAVAAPPGVAPQ